MSENITKEQLLIDYVISNKELYIKVMGVFNPEYFEYPYNQVVKFINQYFMEYNGVPNADIIEAETEVKCQERPVSKDQFGYTVDEIEKYCKNMAMRNAILESADILEDGDFGSIESKIRSALMVSIEKHLGTDQFSDPATRLLKMMEDIDERSIGWPTVDGLVQGIRRGEMLIFAGGSGGGKSVCLANVANNMAQQGLDVVIFSLELIEALVSKRMDSIITGIATQDLFDNIEDVVNVLQQESTRYGSILTKKLPNGSRAIDMRSYLLEYELQYSKTPDVIIVDYLDLMSPNEKINNANKFDVDKLIAEQLRDLFVEYNVYGFTASQLNRDSVNTDKKTHAHIAGGLSKINTCDGAIALSANEEDQKKHVIKFQQLKSRNGESVDYHVDIYLDPKTLRLTETPPQLSKSSGLGAKLAQTKTVHQTKPKKTVQDIVSKYSRGK